MSRLLRDVAIAIEHGYIDPVSLQKKIDRLLERELAKCPDIREMNGAPGKGLVDILPGGRW